MDWGNILSVLVQLIILAVLLERALSVVFEHRLFLARLGGRGVKEVIAFLVSLFVCMHWNIDVVSTIFATDPSLIGIIVTAAVITGLIKVSIRFFQDILGIQSTAYREYTWASYIPERTSSRKEQNNDDLLLSKNKPRDQENVGWATQELFKEVLRIFGAVAIALILGYLGFKTG